MSSYRKILIKRWFGYSFDIANDPLFSTDINDGIRSVIGDDQFDRLCRLSENHHLTACNESNGASVLMITVPYNDETEKAQIEATLENIVSLYLMNAELPVCIYIKWHFRKDIMLPYVCVYYPRSKQESVHVRNLIKAESRKELNKFMPVTDDEEDI